MVSALTQTLIYYQQLIDKTTFPTGKETERVFILSDVDWQDYEYLLDLYGDDAPVKFKYSQGILQIMSPSRRHERNKKIIGLLLEAYLLERKIRFYPLGSLTLRMEGLQKGIEPDECYCFQSPKAFPDLAIEVVVTSGGINSLEIYQALWVREVWFWQSDQLSVYVLETSGYVKIKQSSLLPELDLALLANYIGWEEPFDAVLAFREQMRKISD